MSAFLSFFMNPWTLVAGAALVSTPIIIHLINRMRFRRVKWAAMEFLLKAQKKMRRKKILEQLLLLLLRCLLVFLAGLLFARFLGLNPDEGKETRPVLHVVVLDNTPSMADSGAAGGGPGTDAFSLARTQISEKIVPAALKATTPQRLRIIRLSDQTDILNKGDKEPELMTAKIKDTVQGILARRNSPPRTSARRGAEARRNSSTGRPAPRPARLFTSSPTCGRLTGRPRARPSPRE